MKEFFNDWGMVILCVCAILTTLSTLTIWAYVADIEKFKDNMRQIVNRLDDISNEDLNWISSYVHAISDRLACMDDDHERLKTTNEHLCDVIIKQDEMRKMMYHCNEETNKRLVDLDQTCRLIAKKLKKPKKDAQC